MEPYQFNKDFLMPNKIPASRWTDASPILDVHHPNIQRLVLDRGWRSLEPSARIGAVYDFVRDEVAFGYNASDNLPASQVLSDRLGQCNTKGNLFMALLRAVDIPCRFHGFTIDKALQRGAINEAVKKAHSHTRQFGCA